MTKVRGIMADEMVERACLMKKMVEKWTSLVMTYYMRTVSYVIAVLAM